MKNELSDWEKLLEAQRSIYQDQPVNTFVPRAATQAIKKESGVVYKNDITYADDYPNSTFDILYSDDQYSSRPTWIHIHGGGFLFGPVQGACYRHTDRTSLIDAIAEKGYNVVAVRYALSPDYKFPTPIIQMNQVIAYLKENAAGLKLDMREVVIGGDSAGAILAAQYACLATPPAAQAAYGIVPSISESELKAVMLDDGLYDPDIKHAGLFDAMISLHIGEMDRSNPNYTTYSIFNYIDSSYPPTFLASGNTDTFEEDQIKLDQRLEELGVSHDFFFMPRTQRVLGHCFLVSYSTLDVANECALRMMKFINGATGLEAPVEPFY
jgi:acetyl esterase/lipase